MVFPLMLLSHRNIVLLLHRNICSSQCHKVMTIPVNVSCIILKYSRKFWFEKSNCDYNNLKLMRAFPSLSVIANSLNGSCTKVIQQKYFEPITALICSCDFVIYILSISIHFLSDRPHVFLQENSFRMETALLFT